MSKQGVISLGINLDYQQKLQEMTSAFRGELSKLQSEMSKVSFSSNMSAQIDSLRQKIASLETQMGSSFEQFNKGKLDTSVFQQYQQSVTTTFEKMEREIADVAADLAKLREEFGLLNGSDAASKLKAQFDEWRTSITGAYQELISLVDFVNTGMTSPVQNTKVFDSEKIKLYTASLKELAQIEKSYSTTSKNYVLGDNIIKGEKSPTEMKAAFKEQIVLLNTLSKEYNNLKQTQKTGIFSEADEARLVQIQAKMLGVAQTIEVIDDALVRGTSFGSQITDKIGDKLDKVYGFEGQINAYKKRIGAIVSEGQKAAGQAVTSASTFQVKNGAIHIPVKLSTQDTTLRKMLQEITGKLQKYASSKSIIVNVKLQLDQSSKSGYKSNADIQKQITEGQKKGAVDISASLDKIFMQSVRSAEKAARQAIKSIQEIFKSSPIKIEPDTQGFIEKIQTMVNSSMKNIATNTSKLNVNQELGNLVSSLDKVTATLSGTGGFKLGLDEASVVRITAAVENMANMIQRAFHVASDGDIFKQWSSIEAKFKSVAGESGKLRVGVKDQKIAIQELALEYKKYLDMGGTNKLSALTNDKTTINNLSNAYKNLSASAEEASKKQQLHKTTSKTSDDGKSSIQATTKANKSLEFQATKTSTAIRDESNATLMASKNFKKLATEKLLATQANKELEKSAIATAKALTAEGNAKKNASKTKINTVDSSVYATNASNWQNSIVQGLLSGGNFTDVFKASISQNAKGVVQFSAYVLDAMSDSENAWKRFSATINADGSIDKQTIKIKNLSEKQIQSIEATRNAYASMTSTTSIAPKFLSESEMMGYSQQIVSAMQAMEGLGAQYKAIVNSDGSVNITKTFADAGGEIQSFTARFASIDDIIDISTGKVKNLGAALKEAFATGSSGSATRSVSNFQQQAQDALQQFRVKYSGHQFFGDITEQLTMLEQKIQTVGTKSGLGVFKQDLSDLGVLLRNAEKDSKLGALVSQSSFKNINDLKANLTSVLSSIGKVNEKSIRVKNMESLTANIKMANGEIHKMTVNLDSKGFARYVDNGIAQFGRLRSAVETVFKSMKNFLGYYISPYMMIMHMRRIINSVREVDTAMTELRKVSDASVSDLGTYFDTAVDSAKELGSTVKDMIAATADWSRMGYNLPDSKKLAEIATIYKNVGDGIDIDTANESLISTLQGFQLKTDDAMSIIDSFNEVSNNYAISSGGIGEALKRSAAAFNAANTDMNQAIALITAGNEVVQNPEKIGTMWQTVSARIRGTKSELEDLGEDTENILSSSKLRSLVAGYTDVDIMKDDNTYKDMYTIISEIGEKWKDLKDIEQAALLEGLAGKRQSNTLAAVLNNYERLKEIYKTAEGSAGSAMREQEKYTESIQYSFDQLTAHSEDLWTTFINKKDLKEIIDLLNIFIARLTAVIDTFGSLPTVGAILGAFAGIKNVGINMLVTYLSNRYCFELPTI